MEKNLENKAKFFAQYFGQKILKKDIIGLEKFITEPDGFLRSMSQEIYLELKPLSSITDEDMSKMANFYEKSATNIYIHDFQLTFDYYEGDETHSVAVDLDYGYCLDYLRNNGFATDWMGLPVEKLQEYGWIKLKSE